jgi:hypothetical protein
VLVTTQRSTTIGTVPGTPVSTTETIGPLTITTRSDGVTLTRTSTNRLVLTDARLIVAGRLASLDIAGLVSGSANFEVVKRLVDVNLDGGGFGAADLQGATLLAIGLTNLQLTVGTNDFGVRITGGNIRLATISPTIAPGAPADARSWLALQADSLSATIALGSLVTATVQDVALEINQAKAATAGGTPVYLDWTTQVGTAAGSAFTAEPVTVAGRAITLSGNRLAVSGELTGLSIADLLFGSAKFALIRDTVDVDLTGNGLVDLDNATLLLVSLTDLQLTVGTADFGVAITSGNIRVASLAPAAPADPRRWLAVQAAGLGATLDVGPLVQATLSNVALAVNTASGLAPVLNWKTAIDTDESGAFSSTPVSVGGAEIELIDDRLEVSGTLGALNIADFLLGSASFTLKRSAVTLDFPGTNQDVPNATMLTLAIRDLNLKVGDPNGVHIALNGGALALVTVKANAPPAGSARVDTRSWLALTGTIASASFEGLPGIGLEVLAVGIEINRASGTLDPDGPGATAPIAALPIDFRSAFDLDRNGVRGEPQDRVTVGGTTFELAGEAFRATGTVRLDLFGLVSGVVGFGFEQRTVDVDLDGNGTTDLDDARLTTLALRILGDDGDASNGVEGLFVGAAGVGFTVDAGTLAIAALTPKAPAPGTTPPATPDARSWLAVSANLTNGRFTGIEGLSLGILSLDVEINRGTDAAALDWTRAVDTDPTGTFASTPVAIRVGNGVGFDELAVDYATERLRASGRVTLDLLGFVTGTVGFSFETRKVDVDLDGGPFAPSPTGDLDEATLTLLSLEVEDVFVGVPGGVGFRVGAGSLALATLKATPPAPGGPAVTPDGRSWTALRAELTGGAFEGIDGLTLELTSLGLELNRAAGTPTAPAPLNWTTAIRFADAGAFGDDVVVTTATGRQIAIDFTGDVALRATGVATIDLFGIASGQVGFAFEQRTVDADVDGNGTLDLDEARLTTLLFEINPSATPAGALFLGFDGIGFRVQSGTLGLAILQAAAPAAGAPAATIDRRSWLTVSSRINGAGFEGIPGLTLVAHTLQLEINRSSGTPAPPRVLDWGGALRFADSGAFGDDLVLTGPTGTTVTLGLAGPVLRIAADATLRLEGFVVVDGRFAFEQGPVLEAPIAGTTTRQRVTVMTVGVSDANVFAGIGDPDSNGDGRFTAADDPTATGAVGVALQDVQVALGLFKPEAPAGPGPAPAATKSWLALKASGLAKLVGIDEVRLEGFLTVEVNQASDSALPAGTLAPVIDFTRLAGGGLSVPTGPDPDGAGPQAAPSMLLDFAGRLLRVAGTATVGLLDVAFVTASFAIERGEPLGVTLTDPDGTGPRQARTGTVTALRIGATGGRGFFGVGGPYWKDSNGDGRIDDTDTPDAAGALGLVVRDLELAMILATPSTALAGQAGVAKLFALSATGSVSLVGLDGFEASLTNLSIEINRGTNAAGVPADAPAPVINFGALPGGGLDVATGPDPDGSGPGMAPTRRLAFTGPVVRASGTLTLRIDEFVFLTGSAAFEQGATLTNVRLSDGTTAPSLTTLRVGASDVFAFVGTGGPYWVDSNGDGIVNGADTPNAAGAVGLALGDVDVALVLLKPTVAGTAPASTRSFFSLKATASSVALVGVAGVTIQATNLVVEVNTSSDRTVVAPAVPPVVDFSALPGGGLAVTTGPDPDGSGPQPAPSLRLTAATRAIKAEGRVVFGIAGVSLGADISFEQATRPNGTKATRIAIGDLELNVGDTFSFVTGNPSAPGRQVTNGFLLLTAQGMSGRFVLNDLGFNVGDTQFGAPPGRRGRRNRDQHLAGGGQRPAAAHHAARRPVLPAVGDRRRARRLRRGHAVHPARRLPVRAADGRHRHRRPEVRPRRRLGRRGHLQRRRGDRPGQPDQRAGRAHHPQRDAGPAHDGRHGRRPQRRLRRRAAVRRRVERDPAARQHLQQPGRRDARRRRAQHPRQRPGADVRPRPDEPLDLLRRHPHAERRLHDDERQRDRQDRLRRPQRRAVPRLGPVPPRRRLDQPGRGRHRHHRSGRRHRVLRERSGHQRRRHLRDLRLRRGRPGRARRPPALRQRPRAHQPHRPGHHRRDRAAGRPDRQRRRRPRRRGRRGQHRPAVHDHRPRGRHPDRRQLPRRARPRRALRAQRRVAVRHPWQRDVHRGPERPARRRHPHRRGGDQRAHRRRDPGDLRPARRRPVRLRRRPAVRAAGLPGHRLLHLRLAHHDDRDAAEPAPRADRRPRQPVRRPERAVGARQHRAALPRHLRHRPEPGGRRRRLADRRLRRVRPPRSGCRERGRQRPRDAPRPDRRPAPLPLQLHRQLRRRRAAGSAQLGRDRLPAGDLPGQPGNDEPGRQLFVLRLVPRPRLRRHLDRDEHRSAGPDGPAAEPVRGRGPDAAAARPAALRRRELRRRARDGRRHQRRRDPPARRGRPGALRSHP